MRDPIDQVPEWVLWVGAVLAIAAVAVVWWMVPA